MSSDPQMLRDRIEIIELELHESQRKQQALIASLQRAKAELVALEGGITFFDGERLCGG
jgi:hypothetical protein